MDNIEKDIAQGYADFADDEGSIEEVEAEENIVTENSTSFSFEENTNFSEMSDINRKLRTYFDGKIVRKDLTKSIKEGANVPVYVLEFLLGQYCSSDDPSIIEEGVANVKRILADNYVRPDEAQKILSLLRQRGSHTVIDKITVNLNIKKDTYEAEFSNLGIKAIPISEDYPSKFDRLLCGGIWCIVQLEYEYIEEDKNASPIHIRKLTPIQMPHVDINELKQGRKAFTKDEWISVMLRSIGMEPDTLTEREKWLLLARMLPLVENNFNLCELGPRSTGKAASSLYKLTRIHLVKKERFDEFMKHIYKVPGTNKQIIKKFARIGEASIIYSIGRHRFIELARAAGATYKINEGTGGTVLINLEIFDNYMEQFRQPARPLKEPLYGQEEGELNE